MTQVCSLLSSTAGVKTYENKRLPKGIRIVEADEKTASRIERMPESNDLKLSWGYLFIQHYAAEALERKLENTRIEGEFVPKCFIHRTLRYKRKPNGKGVVRKEKPSVSGLVFLQGETEALQNFLLKNFPKYHLVNNCMTGKPASIPNSVMVPFMKVMESEPERVTFLRDPFIKFAQGHVKLRVLTGPFIGQEGYVVRVKRDRQLVMDLGGYAVAISDVHNEDFEVVE